MQRVLIRADIGGAHGMGHAVRMRALARVLNAYGQDVVFVTTTPDTLRPFVAPFRCDSTQTTTLCTRGDVLVIDTKAPDWANDPAALWLARDAGLRIVRIDHPQATPDTCDLLVGPCAHWDAATVEHMYAEWGELFLYGWNYVLLDDSVMQQAPVPYAKRFPGTIVCCAGGSDPGGLLPRWWEWLNRCEDLPVRMFLRPHYAVSTSPGSDDMQYGHGRPHPGQLTIPFSATALRQAGLVVTMIGQVVYECLAYQTPCLVFARESADVPLLEELEKASSGAIIPAGDVMHCTSETFRRLVRHWWRYPWRHQTARTCARLLDGRGVQRVADAIVTLYRPRFEGSSLSEGF